MTKKITVIPGDGIGKEITEAAVAVLKKADGKFGLSLEYDYHDAGGTAYDKFGTPLPEETLAAAKASDGVLFGAVGGDKWDS
ncbi:MAG: 3-isopropylmalate dehydrogenase, partial [Schwartzia sp.]|nr:3-isopropylmalate dehydrogenase [Schwartzia sp. (in: firmicutes)]